MIIELLYKTCTVVLKNTKNNSILAHVMWHNLMNLRNELTFAILPSRVPGQTEKRREENNRSGNSSMSEPHLISAPPRAAASGPPDPDEHKRFRGADRR